MLLGLSFLHQNHIVHRELKPENILFTDKEEVKIYDFGSSKILKYENNKVITKSTTFKVSAPELIFGKVDYDGKIDIFAAGCIIAELFICNPLFPGASEGLQIMEYLNIIDKPDFSFFKQFKLPENFINYIKKYNEYDVYPLDKTLNPIKKYNKEDIEDAVDLLYNILNWDYNKRFTAEQCLEHKFFRNVEIGNN